MENKLEEGQIVYLAGGQEARFVGEIGGNYVVAPVFEDYDGNEYYGDPQIMPKAQVYATSPKEKIAHEITNLKQKLADLRAEHSSLLGDIASAKRDHDVMIKKITAIPALRNIQRFIDGEFTHIVEEGWDTQILTLQDALQKHDRYDKGLKLMTLFGKEPNNFSFRLDRYSDGSGGSSTVVHLCLSYEEAKEKLGEILRARAAEYLKVGQAHNLGNIVKAANEAGILLPAEVNEAWTARKLKSATEHRAKLLADLAQSDLDIASLTES